MREEIKQRIEQIRRGEVPEGYKRTKVGIVPEEWEEGFLGNYIQEYRELSNDIEKYPVYSSSRQGLITQSQYYDNREAVETNLGYKIVPNGYVTYRHMSDDDVFHFNVNNTGGEILVSSEYPVFSSTEKSSLGYIIPMLNDTAHFRYFCRTQKMGGTRTRLYYKNLCTYKSVYPPLAEQEKIAEILQTQDKVITLKEKLIEEKKRQKKYLMQQLLTGKKRLPGFSGEWKTIKLSQISQKITEKNTDFKFNIVFSNSAQNGIIPQTEQFDKDIANDENIDKYYVVPRGCFVYNPRISVTAPCGPINVNHNTYTGVMSPLYTVFSVNSELIDNDYLEQYFKSTIWFRYMNSIANYGARHDRMSITDDDFFNMPIKLGGVDEQYAIKKILVAADKEIEILQKDLGQEKQKKKALMQLLLTGIARV